MLSAPLRGAIAKEVMMKFRLVLILLLFSSLPATAASDKLDQAVNILLAETGGELMAAKQIWQEGEIFFLIKILKKGRIKSYKVSEMTSQRLLKLENKSY